MPWTEITRRQYERNGLCYASELTDEEWSLIEPFLPKPKPLGRPRTTELRSALADAEQAASSAARLLLGHQAQPSGKLAAILEACSVTDGGN